MNNKERLSKLVANYGNYSRREVDKLIEEKKVKVNGKVATLGQKISIDDKVEINNKVIKFKLKHEYYLLNKPKGYICSRVDNKGKQAISLIDNNTERNIFTIGRLDVQTTGLIIVTSDGYLSDKVNKPDSNINKTYLAWLKKPLSKSDQLKIKKGIKLNDGYTTKPVKKLKMISNTIEDGVLFKITIIEGKKNQIRRMFESIDNKVVNLKRTNIASFSIDKIPTGKYKKLTKKEMYDGLGLRQNA